MRKQPSMQSNPYTESLEQLNPYMDPRLYAKANQKLGHEVVAKSKPTSAQLPEPGDLHMVITSPTNSETFTGQRT